jgi:hypothetical protein
LKLAHQARMSSRHMSIVNSRGSKGTMNRAQCSLETQFILGRRSNEQGQF